MELGLYTFAETTLDPATGKQIGAGQRLRDLMEEIELADQLGLDVYGVGEHHRPDFAVSAPAVVLAAAAMRTKRIRLTSAVNVLSSDDPVRVFQEFTTLDLLSNGRAEIMAGRGSFIESFPLFGFPLDQYETLFEEKLEMFAAILEANKTGNPVTWRGTVRPPIDGLKMFPPTESGRLTTWIGVGGSPESVVRAARYAMPLMLA
ncbi:MAG TPA: LLM class flavin-dependent oxidoreductase, partial [Gemmatimonadaceae bacterium]